MKSTKPLAFTLGATALAVAVVLFALLDGRGKSESGEGLRPDALPRPDGAGLAGALEAPGPRPEAPEAEVVSRSPLADPEAAAERVIWILLDPSGEALSGARIALSFEGKTLLEATTGVDGGFTCDEGREGEGELLVLANRSAPQVLEVPLEPGTHMVELERGAVVSGWVTIDGARPSESLPLLLTAGSPLLLEEDIAGRSWGGLGVEAEAMEGVRCPTEADGSFLVYGLREDWRGSIDLPRNYRLVDQTRAAGHWDPHRLVLDGPRVDVVVDAVKLFLLTGRVIDGLEPEPQGVARAWVDADLVYPESIVMQEYQRGTITDDAGRFEVVVRHPTILGGTLTLNSRDHRIHRKVEIAPMTLTGDHDLGDLALTEPESMVTLALRVTEIGGSPVAGAVAATDSSSPISEPTDGEGRTTLSAVATELSTVAVYAAGYEPAEVSVPVEQPDELFVTLRRGTLLKVRFKTPDGEAAARVHARLWSREFPYRDDATIRSYHAYQGAGCTYYTVYEDPEGGSIVRLFAGREGQVSLNDLKPGLPFRLRVDGQYGGVVHEQEIEALRPGEHRSLEVVLERGPKTLRGRVFDREGHPLSQVKVAIECSHSDLSPGHSMTMGTGVDGEGRFEIEDIYAAHVVLRLDAEGFVGFADEALAVPEDGAELEFHLDPAPYTVTVRIEDEDGRRHPASSVSVELAAGSLVFGREVDGEPTAYILRDLPEEEVTVQAYVYGIPYRRAHHPSVPELIIRVPVAGEVEVRVRVAADTVLDGKTLVCLAPAPDSGLEERYAWIVEGGVEPSTFPGVLPGRYEAVVRRYPEGYEHMDRFEELSPRAAVVVTARQTSRVEVRCQD